MTIAYWCVLAAAGLIYAATGLAKGGGRMPTRANSSPREWLGKLEGWPQRANWAQQNGFEVFPIFAAAVIIAEAVHAPQARIDTLALSFVALRVVYILLYLGNLATLRSVVWMAGMGCVVWLFCLGA